MLWLIGVGSSVTANFLCLQLWLQVCYLTNRYRLWLFLPAGLCSFDSKETTVCLNSFWKSVELWYKALSYIMLWFCSLLYFIFLYLLTVRKIYCQPYPLIHKTLKCSECSLRIFVHNVMNGKISSPCDMYEWYNMGAKIAIEILSRTGWPDLGLSRCMAIFQEP